jgi:hypothetical protein
MALEPIDLTMTLRPGAGQNLTAVEALRAVLDAAAAWFRPFEVLGAAGSQRVDIKEIDPRATWRDLPLWRGESIDEFLPLTLIDPGAAGVSQALLDVLPPDGDALHGTAVGALRHALPQDGAREGWYGRMLTARSDTPEAALWNIARLELRWQPDWKEIGIHFPISGYPLTRQLPRLDDEWRIQSTGDLETVTRNRDALLSAASVLRGRLGLTAGDASWQINSEEALHPDDRRALQDWQIRLGRGEA